MAIIVPALRVMPAEELGYDVGNAENLPAGVRVLALLAVHEAAYIELGLPAEFVARDYPGAMAVCVSRLLPK